MVIRRLEVLVVQVHSVVVAIAIRRQVALQFALVQRVPVVLLMVVRQGVIRLRTLPLQFRHGRQLLHSRFL